MIRFAFSLIALAGCAAWAQGAPPAVSASGAASAAASAPTSAPVVSQAPPQVTPQQTMAPVRPPNMPQYNQQPTGAPQVTRAPVPPAPPTPPVKGLPPDAPKLVINGGIYSERRDMRMAIVNGNVVREGQDVNGVTVEQIRPEGVVLAYRGSRVHVLY
jgi:hypothetical protein